MALFSHILFDMDGTLINSKPGIYHSLQYVLTKMSLPIQAESIVDAIIGPPIEEGLKNYLNLTDREAGLAVQIFREYYADRGIYDAELYPGLEDCLSGLNDMGKRLYVATSKNERFLNPVLEYFDIAVYFTDTIGSWGNGTPTKAELITALMDRNQLHPSDGVVMVGDTHFDLTGARSNEIDSVAVGYGFGDKDRLMSHKPTFFAEDVADLYEILMQE